MRNSAACALDWVAIRKNTILGGYADIDDLETWLLDTGDDIIRKEHARGVASLSAAERAVHDLWAIDYALRNAGDMEALAELRPHAAADLVLFLNGIGQRDLAASVAKLADHEAGSDAYYEVFDQLCTAVRAVLGRTQQ